MIGWKYRLFFVADVDFADNWHGFTNTINVF
jgi:hypothetical protein